MKKRDVKYSKENIVKFFRELRDFISHNKKRIAGTTGVAAITSFITFTSAIAPTMGCNQDDIDAAMNAANNFVNEQTVKPENTTQDVDIPVDVKPTVEPEKTEPVTQDPVEPVEEVNPRDMKAVYGLDFDVPIYTEEEVEIAKENLQTKYQDYNAGYSLTEDQINAIKDDYYIANQDFFYQLYAMTKDMSREDCIQLHLDKNDKFYDSDKDWVIEIGPRGQIIITGNNFRFTKCHSHDDSAGPNILLDVELLFVSSDAYVTIAGPDFYSDCRKDVFDNSVNNMSGEKYDVSNLENVGYHNQEIDNLFVGFDNASDLSLNSNN